MATDTRGGIGVRIVSVRASVIVILHGEDRRLQECVAGLHAQTRPPDEIIAVVSRETPRPALDDDDGPVHTRILEIESWNGPHGARNAGAQSARGDALVFVDADCVSDPEWLARLLAPLADGSADIVGGAVGCSSRRWLDRGAHHAKFGLWLPDSAPGDRPTYPTANLALTRRTWARVGPFRVMGWSGDTELIWRARRSAARTTFAPGAVVHHHQRTSLRALWRERRERGRAYGLVLLASPEGTRRRSVGSVLAAPIRPLVLLWRCMQIAATASTYQLADTIATAPVQLVAQTAWVAGETGVHARRLLPGAAQPGPPVGRWSG
jgi:GT2 family glycosyltransferase